MKAMPPTKKAMMVPACKGLPLVAAARLPPTARPAITANSSAPPRNMPRVAAQMRTKSPYTGFQRPACAPIYALVTSRLL